MPTITHVRDTKLDIDYGYLFDIQSQEELMDYWEKCRSQHIREGIRDVLKHDGTHLTTSYGSILAMRMRVGGEGLVQATAIVESEMLSTMKRLLEEDGRLLVNTNGGYFTPHKHIENVHSTEVPKYILPGNDKISITQWPGGEHFYTRVGNEDVELYGKRKWDTRKEAMSAAVKFLAQKG